MLSEEERQKISVEIDDLKTKIKEIRVDLDKVNKEKEDFFLKKSTYQKQINEIINSVKSLKQERNTLTSQVKISKEHRENVEKKIPELIKKLKELRDENKNITDKLGIKKDYHKLKKEIEALETRIETMPMSFGAEKKIMVQINECRKEMKDAEKVMVIVKEIRKISDELEMYKNIRDISNSKVHQIAKSSQMKHMGMLEEGKKIDELRAKEKEAYEKFKELKGIVKEKAEKLREEISKQNELQQKIGINNQEIKNKEVQKQKLSLSEQRKEVEEKIKNGKKLTTEDFLIMQSDM